MDEHSAILAIEGRFVGSGEFPSDVGASTVGSGRVLSSAYFAERARLVDQPTKPSGVWTDFLSGNSAGQPGILPPSTPSSDPPSPPASG
jgi:hypothetical protein